jgi:hypothetical protein
MREGSVISAGPVPPGAPGTTARAEHRGQEPCFCCSRCPPQRFEQRLYRTNKLIALDWLTFMLQSSICDLGNDWFLLVPYLLLCYHAYLGVRGILLQSSLSSAFATQPGKECTISIWLFASGYCWFIVGVVCTKQFAKGTLIYNDSIPMYLCFAQKITSDAE